MTPREIQANITYFSIYPKGVLSALFSFPGEVDEVEKLAYEVAGGEQLASLPNSERQSIGELFIAYCISYEQMMIEVIDMDLTIDRDRFVERTLPSIFAYINNPRAVQLLNELLLDS